MKRLGTMAIRHGFLRVAVELLVAVNLSMSVAVVASKLGVGVGDSWEEWAAFGIHLGVSVLIVAWRIRKAMLLLVGFGMCSIAWHSTGFSRACSCLGLLDRLGSSAPVLWAATQGLIGAVVLLLYPARRRGARDASDASVAASASLPG